MICRLRLWTNYIGFTVCFAFIMNSMVVASEDLMHPSDSKRRSGSFEDNLDSMYVRHSVIMRLIVRQVPQDGNVGVSFLLIR